MKNLLLVSSHFPPDRSAGTQRVLRFANYLQDQGWSVFVLTVDPGSYRRSIPIDPSLVARVDPRVTVYGAGAFRGVSTVVRWRDRLRTRPARTSPGGGRQVADGTSPEKKAWRRDLMAGVFAFPDEEVGWLASAVMRGFQIIRRHRIEVVVSSAPPFTSHLVARALKSMCDVRWLADFRDPWSRTPWGKRGHARARQWLETQVVTRADAVVLNTPELLHEFTEWYGPATAAKFHVIANGYDADIVERFARARPPVAPPLILTHAGNLYGHRDPTPLLEGLARCIRDEIVPREGIRLNLVGKISPQFNVHNTVARLGLDDVVRITPPIAHDQSLAILASSHVLVVVQPGTALQVPAKLYEYVGLRRPILALTDEGGVARVARDSGLGVVVGATDATGIAAALARLYVTHATGRAVAVDDGATYRFDARRQSEILGELVSTLYRPANAGPIAIVRKRQEMSVK